MEKLFFESEKIDWDNVDEGVSRQIMGYDSRIMLVKVKFEQGSRGVRHKHEHSQTSYVAEGTFEVTIGNKKQVLKKGDSFYVRSDEWHEVLCLEAGLLIDNFSPAREDFIK